jgi:hypothetical protein
VEFETDTKERWNMILTFSRTLYVHVACELVRSSCLPGAIRQASGLQEPLDDRDHARPAVGATEVAHASTANASDCRAGLASCDRSRLTPPEAIALAVARYDRNVSDCKEGIGTCDPSRLTRREAGEVAAAEPRPISGGTDGIGPSDASTVEVEDDAHARNMAACTGGRETCDYSVLSASESAMLATAERLRNYTACVNRRGYCDRTRLTPGEAAATPAEPGVAPSVGRQP